MAHTVSTVITEVSTEMENICRCFRLLVLHNNDQLRVGHCCIVLVTVNQPMTVTVKLSSNNNKEAVYEP